MDGWMMDGWMDGWMYWQTHTATHHGTSVGGGGGCSEVIKPTGVLLCYNFFGKSFLR